MLKKKLKQGKTIGVHKIGGYISTFLKRNLVCKIYLRYL